MRQRDRGEAEGPGRGRGTGERQRDREEAEGPGRGRGRGTGVRQRDRGEAEGPGNACVQVGMQFKYTQKSTENNLWHLPCVYPVANYLCACTDLLLGIGQSRILGHRTQYKAGLCCQYRGITITH